MRSVPAALVVGDTGLLGQAVVAALKASGRPVLGFSASAWDAPPANLLHAVTDLSKDFRDVTKSIEGGRPSLVVNCAGLVDIAACQADPALAARLNLELPRALATACRKADARFVHVSTDQVFDGRASAPYRESDAPRPVHEYGRTKFAGERAALEADPAALVLRTNIVGVRGRGKPTFGEWLCGALARGEAISLAEDFVTSSLFAGDLAQALLLAAADRGLAGLYHAASSEAASKYTFGRFVAEALGADFSRVKRVRLEELKLTPPRPPYLGLNVERFEKEAAARLPGARESARALAAAYQHSQKGRATHV